MEISNPAFLDFTRQPDFKKILTNPILDIAARFWEDDRYEAFRICYRSMRVIDDLVDERKSTGIPLSDDEIARYEKTLDEWAEALQNRYPKDAFQRQLLETIDKFGIPAWPWIRLVKAMRYDLTHTGFPSLLRFFRYCEGAAIAPASIFMHLCGIRSDGDSVEPPPFDIRKAARPLALYSYFVHIVRDFQKDQTDGLNYFADDLMSRHQVTAEDLREAATEGHITPSVRSLFGEYHRIMKYYGDLARRTVDNVLPHLLPRYQLSLELIYNLYHQIFERIDIAGGSFTTSELNPSPEEIQDRIDRVIAAVLSEK
ncbi:MAG TPA: squalene/phytoene synthase family protein [candidate division Zixibacteria bacterium]|nr:squalene/phytoene synthase family protein [candidate division Zixibacteria bacterium]